MLELDAVVNAANKPLAGGSGGTVNNPIVSNLSCLLLSEVRGVAAKEKSVGVDSLTFHLFYPNWQGERGGKWSSSSSHS